MADIIPTWGGGLASVTQKELLARRFAIMPRKLWLYRDGDECVDVTGGWVAAGYIWSTASGNFSATPTIRKAPNVMQATLSFASSTFLRVSGAVQTSQEISTVGYKTLKVHLNYIQGNVPSSGANIEVLYIGTRDKETMIDASKITCKQIGEELIYYDITASFNVADKNMIKPFLGLYVSPNASGKRSISVEVDKIWLE